MINRRRFLQTGAATIFAHTPGLAFTRAYGMSGPFTDYRALVCIFLFGGNDSFNMLVPRSAAEYNVYAASRQNLAVPQEALLPVNPLTSDGTQYGLHPSMTGMQRLFEEGRAAFISNIGPLVEPVTKEQYAQSSVLLPPQLFSHNDQQDQWHSLKGINTGATGWAGRIADLISASVSGQSVATNISLAGTSLFQSADETVAYIMGQQGAVSFSGLGDSGLGLMQKQAFENIIGAGYDSIYARAYADIQQRALAAAALVSSALESVPELNTVFPDSQLGTQLSTVARTIAARAELGMQRQVYFVGAGGFDSHDDQNNDQPVLLGGISEAIEAFYDATVELGMADKVTSFTQSDFGRTLTSNGDGSDHGWGGVQMVVGNAVAGRELYGTYPVLEIDGPDDVSGGRMIPTTSVDQYAATLAKWFGVDDADLGLVAPNIGNFSKQNLGFLI